MDDIGPQPGGGSQAIDPPEIFKNMLSCWAQQYVTITPPPWKISVGWGPGMTYRIATGSAILNDKTSR